MSEKEKNYFVPEQLDDSDFEKEKKEARQAKKKEKFKINKSKIGKLFSIVLIIVLIIVGAYLYLNPIEKKSSKPEQIAKEFCKCFNNKKWNELNNLMDIKGYYVLGAALEEPEYTKFDTYYKSLIEDDEEYDEYIESIQQLFSIDKSNLDGYSDIQIKLNSVESCNLIQGTKTLYKLRVNFDYVYNGKSETVTNSIYVSNASGEYKLVFGEWMQTVLSLYQSIYMF